MKTYHYSVVEEQTRRGYVLAVKDGTTSPDRAGTATTSRVHSSHLSLFYSYRIKGRKKIHRHDFCQSERRHENISHPASAVRLFTGARKMTACPPFRHPYVYIASLSVVHHEPPALSSLVSRFLSHDNIIAHRHSGVKA